MPLGPFVACQAVADLLCHLLLLGLLLLGLHLHLLPVRHRRLHLLHQSPVRVGLAESASTQTTTSARLLVTIAPKRSSRAKQSIIFGAGNPPLNNMCEFISKGG